uniref:hypothetical protein n=1 Tax=Amycolatopsis sp. CA-290885 TaxID=3239925 RepID=UPI003F497AD1
MSNRIIRGEITKQFPVAIDRTAGGRYSCIGPEPGTGVWRARDLEEGEEIGVGTREEMNALIAEQPDDELSVWEANER